MGFPISIIFSLVSDCRVATKRSDLRHWLLATGLELALSSVAVAQTVGAVAKPYPETPSLIETDARGYMLKIAPPEPA